MKYLAILSILLFIGIRKKESKAVFALLYAFLFFIVTHFHAGYDLENYEASFNMNELAPDFADRSATFSLIMLYLNGLGLSFYQFRILCFFAWSVPILLFIIKFSKYPTFVFAICFIFPLLTFGSQIRNGVAVSFVYWALYILFTNKGKRGVLYYIILITLGGLIHYVAFIYLLALLVKSKIPTKNLLSTSIIFAFIAVFILQSGVLYNTAALLIGEYYADFYFTGMEGLHIGNIILSSGIFINCFMSINYANLLISNKSSIDTRFITYGVYIERINIVFLMAIPLLLISGSFYRVFQNVFILTPVLLTLASYVSHSSNRGKETLLNLGYLLFYFCLTFYYNMWQGGIIDGFNSIR